MPRMEQAFSGIYMRNGRPHAVDDLPMDLYRLATETEVAAAEEQATLPPDLTDESTPFG